MFSETNGNVAVLEPEVDLVAGLDAECVAQFLGDHDLPLGSDAVSHTAQYNPAGIPRAGAVSSRQYPRRVLACPNCSLALDVTETGATCPNRHSFDRGRGGYLNLLLGGRLSSDAVPGDTGESLAARRRFLTAGNYDPIAAALAAATAGAPGPVLDVGCGEGWYLTQVQGDRYGLDVSKAAVQMAAKAHQDMMFVVGNAYRLPVLSASVGVVMSVFAPHPFDEFARVLRPDGWWVTVTPGPQHLQEMKPDLSDRERVSERMKRRSEPPSEAQWSTRVQFALQLTEQSAADLYVMTPLRFQKGAGAQGLSEVTVDVWVSSSRPTA